jgi:formamidopyrimidine-DNA glycosylase
VPELPEAETLVRGLRPLLPGSVIRRTTVVHPDVLRVPARRFRSALAGREITAVGRRAKNVVIELDGGEARLVVNLGMTGGLVPLGFGTPRPPRPTHPAVRFAFGDGRALVFNDIRRFGCLEVFDAPGWAARSGRIGPEPLEDDFTPEALAAALGRSRTPIRNWLLDQRRVAGVGNIYASESCFLAGVDPRRPANQVTPREAELLHAGIQSVLSSAIEHGGTTLRDYRNAQGAPGENQRRLHVYGREGEPCPRCGAPVERVVFGNRSAFLCTACQS